MITFARGAMKLDASGIVCVRRLSGCQVKMQELIERALLVAAKCAAFGETVLSIELESGLERRA